MNRRFCLRGSRVLFFLFLIVSLNIHAQRAGGRDDTAVAVQYLNHIVDLIQKEKRDEAAAALVRAQDFKDVLSDIAYLLAVYRQERREFSRTDTVSALKEAIELNRWVFYSENHALHYMAEELIVFRDYKTAIGYLDRAEASGELARNTQMASDNACLRIQALGAMAYSDPQMAAAFRSSVLSAMDSFPRDPRPLFVFFQYARNRLPSHIDPRDGRGDPGDAYLMELVLRRFPFLLEENPALGWLAAQFIWDLEEARRLVGAYRSVRSPDPESIPIALNLGLIDDSTAINEIFNNDEDYGNIENKTINRAVLIDTYNLLRSEAGRHNFTSMLHSFTGVIAADQDNDDFFDTFVMYESGNVVSFNYYKTQDNFLDIFIYFKQSVPFLYEYIYNISKPAMTIVWERFPFVKTAEIKDEFFEFAPADFTFAPVSFITIGGSRDLDGLFFPVPQPENIDLTRYTLLSFCSNLERSSPEIEGAIETIRMNRGVLLQSVETLNGRQVSVTEFENGLPVIQHIDLDLDGRMETIRRFRRPPLDYIWTDFLDYRRLIASSESDWSGDGRHKTREVYQADGSVVYYFDMDGSGSWTHSETGNQR